MAFRPKKILVPTDFSLHSDEALTAAIELATQYGAAITLLHVVPLSDYTAYASQLSPAGAQLDSLETALHQAAQKSIAAQLQRLPTQATIATAVIDGPAPAEICDYAKANGFDLIVLASHGHTGVKRLLLGSIAERVVHHATIPVLVMRNT
ncbi:MAG: universal stress protein [Myxococcaceae bacterium]